MASANEHTQGPVALTLTGRAHTLAAGHTLTGRALTLTGRTRGE